MSGFATLRRPYSLYYYCLLYFQRYKIIRINSRHVPPKMLDTMINVVLLVFDLDGHDNRHDDGEGVGDGVRGDGGDGVGRGIWR